MRRRRKRGSSNPPFWVIGIGEISYPNLIVAGAVRLRLTRVGLRGVAGDWARQTKHSPPDNRAFSTLDWDVLDVAYQLNHTD